MQGLKKSQLKNQTFVHDLYGKTEQKRKKNILRGNFHFEKRKRAFFPVGGFRYIFFTGLTVTLTDSA